ncbi:MAG: hypothetical protein R3E48_13695 [Burkholderiaceae bacterium]
MLADRLDLLLMHGTMSASLRERITTAVESVTIPADPTRVAGALRNRAMLATFLVLASPEYLVMK